MHIAQTTDIVPPFAKPDIENPQKRVRVLFGGQWIADTKKPKLVWEANSPAYFFVSTEIPSKYLRRSESAAPGQRKDEHQITFDVVAGQKAAKGAAVQYGDGAGDLAGLTKITFGAMDGWFEEEDQIFAGPKNPYHRVDVLQSSRHVRIEVEGIEVANSHKPRLLYETGLPVRTYIPKTDCRLDLLEPSDLTSQCPYKGVASYYSVRLPKTNRLVKDVVWWYRTPQTECSEIKGYAAFWDEKVDVWVDGEKQ